MGENVASPVYAVYYPADIAKSPRNVFMTLKEAVNFANSPEGKSKGARFNRFGTPKEAMDFFDSGDCRSPPPQPATPTLMSEPTIPHPSVSRIDMNKLKRAIEKESVQAVCELVDSNPRFLVNTNGDIAAIVMEGFRFNALHIAARHGKSDVVEKVLELVSNIDFLADLYGTSKEDAQFRANNIMASYLNTPDKGNCETPLHLASKFGHVDVVRVLVNQPLLEKHLLNNEGKTALEIACGRYSGEDKKRRKDEIELLLGGFFVAVYRSPDNSAPAKIVASETFPKLTLPLDIEGPCSPLLSALKLTGYAGPFGSKEKAAQFLTNWTGSEKHVKLSDVDKGYERVGRELSAKINVKWAESWCFIDQFVDLRTEEGLGALNSYLGRMKQKDSSLPADDLRKRLVFDDEDDQPRCLTPSEDGFLDDDDDKFEDAAEEEPNDFGEFFTPPATPPPVYLLDNPTKVDNDVLNALASVPQEKIDLFPHVRQFTEKLNRVSNRVRSEWPSLDSPRRAKSKGRVTTN
nr:Ankyrin domain containing protein [Haemonchus contortus]